MQARQTGHPSRSAVPRSCRPAPVAQGRLVNHGHIVGGGLVMLHVAAVDKLQLQVARQEPTRHGRMQAKALAQTATRKCTGRTAAPAHKSKHCVSESCQ